VVVVLLAAALFSRSETDKKSLGPPLRRAFFVPFWGVNKTSWKAEKAEMQTKGLPERVWVLRKLEFSEHLAI
jgi:hypothetical protein